MGMEITDQVKKREKMAKLREEIAVQKAKETELNKTIHITEETMRAKQMLATMSHEIRSPLSGVVSMAEILSTTKLDRDQKQLLSVMLSSGDLVLQLINDILDLSKVESGVMKLEATKFRPREVIKHVLQTAAASLKKMLILEGHVSDDVPVEVIGDVLRIRQILTNLISNAIKFTHQGKVEINLYVVADPHPEGQQEQKMDNDDTSVSQNAEMLENEPHSHETVVWIRCDVKDTGIGIPETALPNLFKKYMQAGADTQRKYGGTGLGLAICKQLVELMGGHLTVSSIEHCGSTFTFTLPYKVSHACDSSDDTDEFGDMADNESTDDDFSSFDNSSEPENSSKCNSDIENTNCNKKENQDDLPVASCSPSDNHSSNLCEARKDSDRSSEHSSSNQQEIVKSEKKPKILLVEDHVVNVMVAKRMMKQLNQDMDIVNNGAEAVRAVQKCKYDLILMDVCMPVMDGLEATRLIRSFEKTGNWDEATKAGVEPCASPSCDQNLEEPRRRIPIIAMTANAMSESAEECFENGMDSFITKPVTLQNLKQCLEPYVE